MIAAGRKAWQTMRTTIKVRFADEFPVTISFKVIFSGIWQTLAPISLGKL